MSAQAVKQQLKALQADNEGRTLSKSQQVEKKKEKPSDRKQKQSKQQQQSRRHKARPPQLANGGVKKGGEAARQRNLFLKDTQASKHSDRVDRLMRKALGMPEKPEMVEETDEDLLAWFG